VEIMKEGNMERKQSVDKILRCNQTNVRRFEGYIQDFDTIYYKTILYTMECIKYIILFLI